MSQVSFNAQRLNLIAWNFTHSKETDMSQITEIAKDIVTKINIKANNDNNYFLEFESNNDKKIIFLDNLNKALTQILPNDKCETISSNTVNLNLKALDKQTYNDLFTACSYLERDMACKQGGESFRKLMRVTRHTLEAIREYNETSDKKELESIKTKYLEKINNVNDPILTKFKVFIVSTLSTALVGGALFGAATASQHAAGSLGIILTKAIFILKLVAAGLVALGLKGLFVTIGAPALIAVSGVGVAATSYLIYRYRKEENALKRLCTKFIDVKLEQQLKQQDNQIGKKRRVAIETINQRRNPTTVTFEEPDLPPLVSIEEIPLPMPENLPPPPPSVLQPPPKLVTPPMLSNDLINI